MSNKEPTPAEISTNTSETVARITGGIKVYTAMWNLPGCLPEMEPFRTLDEAAAREFLADALDDVADQSHDDREGATKAAQDIRDGFSLVVIEDYVYSIESGPPIDDEENRRALLAKHLECALDEVEASTYGENAFESFGREYLILTDDEADTAAAEDIRESVWAFNAEFLVDYVPDGLTAEDITRLRGDSCEDVNDAFVALVKAGRGMDALTEDAIAADGRGHFLAGYDNEEIELGDTVTLYAYRTN